MNNFLSGYLLKSTALIGISAILSTITTTSLRAETLVTTPTTRGAADSCNKEVSIKSLSGKTVCTYANGDRYEGEVANAQPHGQGLMYFANGDRYEGQFQFGKFNGSGTYTFKNGDRRVGQWILDEFASNVNQSDTNTPTANAADIISISTPTSVVIDSSRHTESNTPIQKDYSSDSLIAESSDEPDNPSNLEVSPLQKTPIRLFNLPTANQLEAGDLSLSAGVRFAGPDQTGKGSGLQVDYGYFDYGLTNDFQIGLNVAFFDDTLGRRINGNVANLVLNAVAPNVKYQVFKDDGLQVAVAGSVEVVQLSSDGGLFGSSSSKDYNHLFVGSLQVPVTYNATRDLQLHFTPGLALFPSSLNGSDFYGTLFKIGTGLSWQATDRLGLFADVNFPIGGKGNAINASNGNFSQRIIYSGGLRYLVTPAVGVDLYATNGFSNTPATSFLAFIPDGNQLAIGANLTYTPNTGKNFASTFRQGTPVALSNRDTQLLLDGFNLASADTLLPGAFHVWGGLGSGTNVNVAYGVTNDLQVELFGQKFNRNGDPTPLSKNSDSAFKLGAAAKVRFFDQVQGDPVSLGLKLAVSFVRTFNENSAGYFVLEMPTSYSLNPQLSFKFNPKAGFVSSESRFGLGLGINYALIDDLQFIGELTPLLKSNTGQGSVWSVGLRYLYPQTNVGVDVYLSNSIGQNALGGLFSQSNGSSLGFNMHWLFGQ
jgi:hypothetical protein